MATVTPPARAWNAEESHRRVAHPLQKLRGYIRGYVSAEGAAVLLLYLALWFWLGLLFDYGLFKLFTLDLVQELPWGLRAGMLGVLVAGLVAVVITKVLLRLLREFRDAPLAMVLERRFPAELGDRLITAVELADVKRAEEYGYSGPMIEHTIRDAGERVEKLPVQEVFDWKRLRRLGLTVVGATLGVLVLVWAAYGAYFQVRGGAWGTGFGSRFGDVAGIWFERNILLQNTIWPRKAHLELVSFDGKPIVVGEELKIGRDAPPPSLRVRAIKWVVADKDAAEGWRALRWADVTPDLLGADVPAADMREWPARDREVGLTVDDIELRLARPEAHTTIDVRTKDALRNVLTQLEERAAAPKMSRRLRMLDIPETVYVVSRSSGSKNEMTLEKQGDNEYTGSFADLRESVRFSARAEDYYTTSRPITVVPPPMLTTLVCDKLEPAYFYYRIPKGGKVDDLRGRKQLYKNLTVSLNGEKSSFSVGAGTDVILTAKSDKELKDARLLPPRKGVAPVEGAVKLLDSTTFQVRFNNVRPRADRPKLDFIFEFTDTDNVVGLRHVEINPTIDLPPDVEAVPDALRKTSQGYMVTVMAQVPFSGKVHDDHGLDSVEYVYTITRLDSTTAEHGGLVPLAAVVTQLAGGPDQSLPAAANVVTLVRDVKAAREDRSPQRVALASFAERLRGRAGDEVPPTLEDYRNLLTMDMDHLRKLAAVDPRKATAEEKEERRRLKELWVPTPPLLADFLLDPEDSQTSFDLEKLPRRLRVDSDHEIQPRYKMQLAVLATDNDIETNPGSDRGKEGVSRERFTFILVSENELLSEIGKEEEGLQLKFQDTILRLDEGGKKRLDPVNSELAGATPKADRFTSMSVEVEDMQQILDKALSAANEVHTDYRRILRELEMNRVQIGMIKRVKDNICDPLKDAINQEFVRTQEALDELHKGMESPETDLAKKAEQSRAAAANAKAQLELLVRRLNNILGAMEGIATINRLVDALRKIEQEEQSQVEQLKELRKKLEDEVFKDAEGEKPKKKP